MLAFYNPNYFPWPLSGTRTARRDNIPQRPAPEDVPPAAWRISSQITGQQRLQSIELSTRTSCSRPPKPFLEVDGAWSRFDTWAWRKWKIKLVQPGEIARRRLNSGRNHLGAYLVVTCSLNPASRSGTWWSFYRRLRSCLLCKQVAKEKLVGEQFSALCWAPCS